MFVKNREHMYEILAYVDMNSPKDDRREVCFSTFVT